MPDASPIASTDYAPLVLAIATLVTALAAAISSFLNRGANARTEKKAEEIDKKVEVVAAHVNSAATEAKNMISALQKQVADLLALGAEKDKTAALLAQSAATTAATQAAVTPVPAPTEVVVVNEPHDPVPTTTAKTAKP